MKLDDAAREEIRWRISEAISSLNVAMHWVDSSVSKVRYYAVFDKRRPAGCRQVSEAKPHAEAQALREALIATEVIDAIERILEDA